MLRLGGNGGHGEDGAKGKGGVLSVYVAEVRRAESDLVVDGSV